MNRGKKLEVNYRAYTLLLIRQKLPYLLTGIIVFIIISTLVLAKIIIRKKPAAKKAAGTAKTAVRKYTVQEGEDLWQISEKLYGSGFNAYDIAKANNLTEPYILQKDQVLVIPDVTKRFPTHGEITTEAASTSKGSITGSTYTVQDGDYLFSIAERIYGDGNQMQKLIDANNIPAPYNIEVGQVLKIPR